MTTEDTKMLTNAIEDDLFSRYGPLLSDDALRMALGYRSIDAFRKKRIGRQT
jgi:hypothetical protein